MSTSGTFAQEKRGPSIGSTPQQSQRIPWIEIKKERVIHRKAISLRLPVPMSVFLAPKLQG